MFTNNNKPLNINQTGEELWMNDPINGTMIITTNFTQETKNTSPLKESTIDNLPNNAMEVEYPTTKKVYMPKKVIENDYNNDYSNDYNNYYYNNGYNNDYDNYNMNNNMYKTLRNNCYEEISQPRRNQRIINDNNQYNNFYNPNFFNSGLNRTFRNMNNSQFGNFYF